MARAGRQLHVGGWYHVYNRGLSSRAVFESRFDRRFFLSLLAKQVRARRLLVHAYCLMTNHYHLLVELPGTELPTAMREVARHYTRRFNARRDRDGPLFRARYASRYVEDSVYRDTVLCYIDQNPVKSGLVQQAVDYPWCSARDFDQGIARPWLERGWVEDVVRRGTGTAGLRPGSYRALRDPRRVWNPHAEEFVASRLASSSEESGVWELEAFDAWLEERTRLAEGGVAMQPMAAPGAIQAVVRESRNRFGVWEVHRGGRAVDLHEVLLLAALRLVAGRPIRELRATVVTSASQLRRRLELHAELYGSNEAYRIRFESIANDSRARSLTTTRHHASAEPE